MGSDTRSDRRQQLTTDEYSCSVRSHTAHVKNIGVAMNDTVRIITGCLRICRVELHHCGIQPTKRLPKFKTSRRSSLQFRRFYKRRPRRKYENQRAPLNIVFLFFLLFVQQCCLSTVPGCPIRFDYHQRVFSGYLFSAGKSLADIISARQTFGNR